MHRLADPAAAAAAAEPAAAAAALFAACRMSCQRCGLCASNAVAKHFRAASFGAI